MYPFGWTIPDPKYADPKTGFCQSPIPRFGNSTRCKTLDPDYKKKWAATFATIEPFINNGTIIGVFLSDEQMWAGATLANWDVDEFYNFLMHFSKRQYLISKK